MRKSVLLAKILESYFKKRVESCVITWGKCRQDLRLEHVTFTASLFAACREQKGVLKGRGNKRSCYLSTTHGDGSLTKPGDCNSSKNRAS